MLIRSEKKGHILEHDEEQHIYLLDNKILDGVTTILGGGYPKSQKIIEWQMKEAMKWFWDQTAGADPHIIDSKLEELLKEALTASSRGSDRKSVV